MRIFFLFLFSVSISALLAQDSDVLLNHDLYHYVDRLDIKGLTDKTIHTDVKPYNRKQLSEVFAAVDTTALSWEEKKWHKRMYTLASDDYADATNPSLRLKYFYENKRDFYRYTSPNFRIYINPALHVAMGQEISDSNRLISTNARGAVIRGDVLNKIGFYTELYDNVLLAPQYQRNSVQFNGQALTTPMWGETFVKPFRNDGLTFFSTRAYATYSPIKQMRIKFGHDKAFWGNGMQSLLLSDNPANYLMLNIRTQIWKLEYSNLFTQMLDFVPNKPDGIGTYPRKYGVFHQLSFKPNAKFSVSVFESIIYSQYNASGKRGFELQYLNPIIFYRSLEQSLGSADNGFIGFSAKYNFAKHFQVYGQFLLDELRVSKIKEGLGTGIGYAWSYLNNKTGYQLGAKYIDVAGITGLDAQVELNALRPYTYQHFNISSNYTNFGQSLGYALGPNAKDFNASLNYHPLAAWNFYLSYMNAVKGYDIGTLNYGGNINLPNGNVPVLDNSGFGYNIGQGTQVKIQQIYGRASWQIFHTDMYLEMEGRYRTENSTRWIGGWLGLRTNIVQRTAKF